MLQLCEFYAILFFIGISIHLVSKEMLSGMSNRYHVYFTHHLTRSLDIFVSIHVIFIAHVSILVPTTPTCDCTNLVPIGVSNGKIPNSRMISHSVLVRSHGRYYTGPEEARLNNQPSENGKGAWEPIDNEAYILIEFGRLYTLREIRMQGSVDNTKKVARFFLFYTTNGIDWKPAYRVRWTLSIALLLDMSNKL